MIAGVAEMIEAAAEVLGGLLDWSVSSGSRSAEVLAERLKDAHADQLPLTAIERDIAAEVVARRGVSPEAAEDLVKWLRTRN